MSVTVKNYDGLSQHLEYLDSKGNLELIEIFLKKNDLYHFPFDYVLRKKNYSLIEKNLLIYGGEVPERRFTATLRKNQKKIFSHAINILTEKRSVMLSCYTGFGKTVTSLAISNYFGMKTLIVVPKVILINQWNNSILSMLESASVYIFLAGKKIISSEILNADIAIVNAINIKKIPEQYLKLFNFVIIDEVHLVFSKKTFLNLLHLTPKMLMGLTATPFRSDDLNKLFYMFFGKNKIYIPLDKLHYIFKVKTNFSPTIRYLYNKKVDWNFILEQQANNEERNKLIIDLIRENITQNENCVILILIKRISQGNYIFEKLNEINIPSTRLFGSNNNLEPDCRILIGTNSKIGTGFDYNKLNTLILAADVVEYYIQFLGRVMRSENIVPRVYDLVDNNSILENHYKLRCKTYVKHGGIIQDYRI